MNERDDNDDDIPVTLEDSSLERPAAGKATRILGSDVIAAALRGASPGPPGTGAPSRGAEGGKPFDPARTRILDMKRLWPQVQVAAATPDEPRQANRADAKHPLISTPASKDMGLESPAGVPKGLRASFRNASPRRRALAIMVPVTLVILLVRVATDPSARPTAPATHTPTENVRTAPDRPAPTATPTSTSTSTATTTATATANPTPTATPTPTSSPSPTPPSLASTGTSPATPHKTSPPRSLERDAVDAVARADYGTALKLYQELAAAHPDRSVFRESARIVAEKIVPAER